MLKKFLHYLDSLTIIISTSTNKSELPIMTAWLVYLDNVCIDTVFYDPDCDAEYVKDGLINHDGYPYGITVKKG